MYPETHSVLVPSYIVDYSITHWDASRRLPFSQSSHNNTDAQNRPGIIPIVHVYAYIPEPFSIVDFGKFQLRFSVLEYPVLISGNVCCSCCCKSSCPGCTPAHLLFFLRIHVVHNGTDPNLFRPREVSQDLQRHLGVADKRVLLTVCRLDPHKGVHFAIEALSHLCREFSDLLYVVIGNGPEYNHLVRLAASLGLRDRVRFLGQVRENEVVFWYNLCDIFMMFPHPIPDRTDLIEGFGISFVEAAACSKPVVACRFGGVTDAVKDGETGLLIEAPPQVPDIVDAIKRLLTCEELRRELGRAGRLRVEKELNWEYVAHQLFKTFREDMQRCKVLEAKQTPSSEK